MSGKTPRDIFPPPGDPQSPGEGDVCDLEIDHDLEGIHQTVLATLGKGQVLTVDVEIENTYKSVVCKTAGGAVVGSLSAFSGIGNLLSCLERGRRYQVLVSEIGPGHCHVRGGLVKT